MSAAKSYAKPAEIGQPMVGGTVGEIVASRHPEFVVADVALGYGGWQEYVVFERHRAAQAPDLDRDGRRRQALSGTTRTGERRRRVAAPARARCMARGAAGGIVGDRFGGKLPSSRTWFVFRP
jgi:NADPH-dependent curcumin reductase CurA